MASEAIKMLSIDDKALTSELDRAGYRNMGILVKHVSSYGEAKEKIAKGGIDIVVINLDYERIDALSICRHLKYEEASKAIPVVVTSVQSSQNTKDRAISAGADLFVEQPVPRQMFVEKLKKLLAQQTRGTDRVELEEAATVTYKNSDLSLPVGDLSTSGILIQSDFAAQPGEKVFLSFIIPGNRKPIAVEGLVVRKIMENNVVTGVGIRFEKFDGDSEKRLERYVAQKADKDGKMIYYL